MKRIPAVLLALPLALGVMGSLGCESGSAKTDADPASPSANLPSENPGEATPQWVTNTSIPKADITVTGMT